MRNYVAPLALAFTFVAISSQVSGQTLASERPADAAAIRAHIESIFQAFVDKDRAKLEATHGAEWRGFTPWSGHVIRGRDGYMNEATFPPDVPRNQGMVGYRIGEFDIVFYGDVGVVTFQAEVDRLQGSEKSTQKLTFIDVYHKEPGGWIQVASNTALHPDAVFELASDSRKLDDGERESLMKAREAVWRAWFAGDEAALRKLLPPELLTIEPGSSTLGTLKSTIDGSQGFASSGGKLTRIVFPMTEMQVYGNTAILYTSYEMDLQVGTEKRTERGMATEAFVLKNGQWLNTGWQLAPAGK